MNVTLLLGLGCFALVSGCSDGADFSGHDARQKPIKAQKEADSKTVPEEFPDESEEDASEQEAVIKAPTLAPPVKEAEPEGHPGAVTKGSFTAWTEPASPAAFQDYQIVIEVKLPSSVVDYPPGDLSGTLFGTDGYDQKILGLPEMIGAHKARIVVDVPGAFFHVRDTIDLKSAMLQETQQIVLTFQ